VYHFSSVVRLLLLVLIPLLMHVACSDKRASSHADEQQLAQRERVIDEKERELDKRLGELATRPLDAGASNPSASRAVPAEKGVPLDKRVLGAVPHPFGPLEPLKPEMTRDDIITAIPGVLRDGDKLTVPSGITGVAIELAFDAANRFATATYTLPAATSRELLASAWGEPTTIGQAGWLDKRKRWRADLSEPSSDTVTLTVIPLVPFSDLIGRGPDGLADKRALIGATLEQLRASFGTRLHEPDDSDEPLELELATSTDICGSSTMLGLELGAAGKVTRAHIQQCFDGDGARRAALAAMEQRWGRATPSRTPDDRLVFSWQLPGRRIEAQTGEAGWELTIAPR
jgi:hypothetical protein